MTGPNSASTSGFDLDVAVVGAGVGGLTAAYRLQQAGRSVQVFEAAPRVGGRMASSRVDGYLIDEGAETIADRGYAATWRLIRELAVPREDLAPIRAGFALWRDGRAHARMGHSLGLLTGAGMSWRGRLAWLRSTTRTLRDRAEFDADRPEVSPVGAATVAEYARSYHPELLDCLLQPFSSHCFGWRPERSTVAPMLALLLAVGGAGARWSTYRGGMDTLARALARQVPVQLGTPALVVERTGADRARLHLVDGRVLTVRQLVLAVPAPVALALDVDATSQERPFLEACTFAPMLKVVCLLDRSLPSPTRTPSYALSVPERESRICAGLLLDHLKAEGRVPAGRGMVTLFASPRSSPDLLDAADEEVARVLAAEAERFLPGLGAATTRTVVHRFRHGLPEATPAALRLRGAFAARPAGPVEYAGDWTLLRPNSEGAVRSGEQAARRLTGSLAATPSFARTRG
ncbi:protoporphyrinogen/coproporphyrinogen oxidase [Streptacidiphilus fuscans]|uniref:FAD-dependent oxidoreductase n=1 Tax=Streptacidiphilus fuscans TaxID=2789292 RepID=A0A931B2V9_9ACTN|nr:NAD(P)/FAD-dependent oxidoreductase [Streptacidiphilus fuscans]MBF9069251.1 FAD-dependent oxidoreductase [Streptacidiphilus fuscans]